MIKPTEIFVDGNREIHFMGSYVGVCFRGKETVDTIVKEGRKYTATVFVKSFEAPYVSFVVLREFGDGTRGVDEDSSVDGGLGSLQEVKKVAKELSMAAEYIENRYWQEPIV